MTENEKSQYEKEAEELYATYIKEREYRDSIHTNQSNLLDTHILAISTAGLGFSTIFIEKFVPIDIASYTYLLFTSWSLFLASIVTTVASFKSSTDICNEQIDILDKRYKDGATIDELTTPIETTYEEMNLRFFNKVSFNGFIWGVIFLVSFISINIEHLGEKTCPNKTDSGLKKALSQAAQPPLPKLPATDPQPLNPHNSSPANQILTSKSAIMSDKKPTNVTDGKAPISPPHSINQTPPSTPLGKEIRNPPIPQKPPVKK